MPDRRDIAWALDELAECSHRYRVYGDYYDGEHRLTFATEKFHNTFGSQFQAFADNLCPLPVDALADRLQIETFTSKNEAASKVAADLWESNRMDRRSGEIHSGGFKMGDAYAIVWPNSLQEVRIWPQEPSNVCVEYDMDEAPDRIIKAAKRWKAQDGRIRLNLYYPDRIEKWVSRTVPRAGTEMRPDYFVEYLPDDGSSTVVLNAWGRVPVFHWANNAGTGEYGRSELRDVIPLQDALNKSVADMLVAMEFVAMPQRWVTGLETEVDEHGRQRPPNFQPGVDRIWAALGDNVSFGEFAAAPLDQFISVQDNFRAEIARVTGLPLHYILPGGGTPPSGEALKVAEARLVKKALDRHVAFGNVWEDLMGFATQVAMGSAPLTDELEVVWEDPETRNDLLEAQTQQAKQAIGVSQQQSLRELGYTDDEITAMSDEKQANQEAFGMAAIQAANAFTGASDQRGQGGQGQVA